ncbi:MAG: rhomboid family intramembrane serine protease, partial [Dokdonella sp.]
YFFGRAMEGFFASYIGEVGFLAFYVGAIVVAILPTYLKNQDNPRYRSLGASGAVSAVLFAFILLQPWTTILVFFIPLPAILYAIGFVCFSIYMGKRGGDNINHSAHLWGAVYGVVVTLAIEPRVFEAFLQQLGNPRFM